MTGWMIAAGILLFLLALLACSVVVRFEYGDEIRLRISYLFITLVRVPQKPGKRKSRRKKRGKSSSKKKKDSLEKAAGPEKEGSAESAEIPEKNETALAEEKGTPAKSEKKSPDKKSKSEKKMSLSDILELVKLAVDSLSKPLKKLLHRTRILDLKLNIVCGGDDAAKAALNYGRTNIAVGAALGYIDTFFTLKRPSVNIGVDFYSEQTLTECSCTVKLSLLAALAFLFTAAGRALIYYLNNKPAAQAVGKLTAK